MTTDEQGSALPPTQRNPATHDFPTGPEIGARFPDITLRNQRGEWVRVAASPEATRSIVVFERSARW